MSITSMAGHADACAHDAAVLHCHLRLPRPATRIDDLPTVPAPQAAAPARDS
jgi:hypothetical protein